MHNRKHGNSDLNITPVGFGAWAIGGAGYDFGWARRKMPTPSLPFIARFSWG
jgi:aryl-alcohol dehydrogenase-like predicted oxidoreductase